MLRGFRFREEILGDNFNVSREIVYSLLEADISAAKIARITDHLTCLCVAELALGRTSSGFQKIPKVEIKHGDVMNNQREPLQGLTPPSYYIGPP